MILNPRKERNIIRETKFWDGMMERFGFVGLSHRSYDTGGGDKAFYVSTHRVGDGTIGTLTYNRFAPLTLYQGFIEPGHYGRMGTAYGRRVDKLPFEYDLQFLERGDEDTAARWIIGMIPARLLLRMGHGKVDPQSVHVLTERMLMRFREDHPTRYAVPWYMSHEGRFFEPIARELARLQKERPELFHPDAVDGYDAFDEYSEPPSPTDHLLANVAP